ncbi:hypothetical protein ACFLU6_03810 [Acidobacteriota bacterium]
MTRDGYRGFNWAWHIGPVSALPQVSSLDRWPLRRNPWAQAVALDRTAGQHYPFLT